MWHVFSNNIFSFKKGILIIILNESENSTENLFVIVHRSIRIHLKDLIIEINFDTLLSQSLLEF